MGKEGKLFVFINSEKKTALELKRELKITLNTHPDEEANGVNPALKNRPKYGVIYPDKMCDNLPKVKHTGRKRAPDLVVDTIKNKAKRHKERIKNERKSPVIIGTVDPIYETINGVTQTVYRYQESESQIITMYDSLSKLAHGILDIPELIPLSDKMPRNDQNPIKRTA
ncbi:hypothetical protein HGB07_00995 [Candidatus Roizmanbacteria bacterium]|nr:hypothetical protein [Candidatus Roizmanbacteria bacterium]